MALGALQTDDSPTGASIGRATSEQGPDRRDLIAGSTNQRQRRLALESARSGRHSRRSRQAVREVAAHPEVPSAFVAGPPLTPARAEDRALFKGRGDVIKLIEHDLAPDRRGVLLVVGQRRMGKTSLCNYLPTYLGTGTVVVVSNFQSLSGDAHRETPHRRVLADIAAHAPGTPAPPESDRWGDGLRWLEELDRACTDRRLLAVIDEIERVEDGIRDGWCSSDFLDFLRAAGDALPPHSFSPAHRLSSAPPRFSLDRSAGERHQPHDLVS
ncbi:MAG TPA: ATP-binding protein [Kofleriaceae bacterium]